MITFEELVAKDVRGECTTSQLATLHADLRRWLQVLNSLLRDVELQLTAQRARMNKNQADYLEAGDKIGWLRYKAEEEEWRIRSVRFMVSVEQKIMEVKGYKANIAQIAA